MVAEFHLACGDRCFDGHVGAGRAQALERVRNESDG